MRWMNKVSACTFSLCRPSFWYLFGCICLCFPMMLLETELFTQVFFSSMFLHILKTEENLQSAGRSLDFLFCSFQIGLGFSLIFWGFLIRWWRAKSQKTPLLSLLWQPTYGLKVEYMCAFALELGLTVFPVAESSLWSLSFVCGRYKMQHIYFQFLSAALWSLKTDFRTAQVLCFSGILVLSVLLFLLKLGGSCPILPPAFQMSVLARSLRDTSLRCKTFVSIESVWRCEWELQQCLHKCVMTASLQLGPAGTLEVVRPDWLLGCGLDISKDFWGIFNQKMR